MAKLHFSWFFIRYPPWPNSNGYGYITIDHHRSPVRKPAPSDAQRLTAELLQGLDDLPHGGEVEIGSAQAPDLCLGKGGLGGLAA